MTPQGELRLALGAEVTSPARMRHALESFLTALNLREDVRIDIVTAVGEALANAVEHAYDASPPGDVDLHARMESDSPILSVDVVDRGTFIERSQRADRGLGLRIVRAVSRSMVLDTSEGTAVRMKFDAPEAEGEKTG